MDKPIQSYKYQKICRLSRCRKSFGTNLKWQEFCMTDHRIEYHNTELKDIRKLADRISNLEREIFNKKKEVIDPKI